MSEHSAWNFRYSRTLWKVTQWGSTNWENFYHISTLYFLRKLLQKIRLVTAIVNRNVRRKEKRNALQTWKGTFEGYFSYGLLCTDGITHFSFPLPVPSRRLFVSLFPSNGTLYLLNSGVLVYNYYNHLREPQLLLHLFSKLSSIHRVLITGTFFWGLLTTEK